MTTITPLATINLIEEVGGRQKLEIIPSGNVDLATLFGTVFNLNKNTVIPTTQHLGHYVMGILSNLDLPVHLYNQSTYSGLRNNVTRATLLFWNCNYRCHYVNISVKSEILAPLKDRFTLGADSRFKNTERVRLTTTEEIDYFFDCLIPELNRLFK